MNHQAMAKRCQKQSKELQVLKMQLQVAETSYSSELPSMPMTRSSSKQVLNLSELKAHSLSKLQPPLKESLKEPFKESSRNTEKMESVSISSPSKKNHFSAYASVSPSNYFRAFEQMRSKRDLSSSRTANDSVSLLKESVTLRDDRKLPRVRQSVPAKNLLSGEAEGIQM